MADQETALTVPERTALIERRTTALTRKRAALRQRLEDSRRRLGAAVERARDEVEQMSPATHIRRAPLRWVVGGLAVGFALALLTRRS